MTPYQLSTLGAQCAIFIDRGAIAKVYCNGSEAFLSYHVAIAWRNKLYKFADPDPEIIIRQLIQLNKPRD